MCHESYDSMVPSLSAQSHTVILQDEGRWLCFAAPRRVIAAWAVEDVLPALRAIEDATAQGLHAAGFLSYEATPAFDPAFRVHPAGALPLMWFGIYDAPLPLDTLPEEYKPFSISTWEPSMTWKAYREAIARIKAYIAAGDTYQVNFTMRLHAHLAGSPWTLFRALTRAQHGKYHAWVHLGSHILCSASPELFFRLEGNHLTCKPMKGYRAARADVGGGRDASR